MPIKPIHCLKIHEKLICKFIKYSYIHNFHCKLLNCKKMISSLFLEAICDTTHFEYHVFPTPPINDLSHPAPPMIYNDL